MSHPLLDQALAAYRQNQLSQAMRLCEAALEQKRNDVRVLVLLAEVHEARGMIPQSIMYIERAIRLRPKDALLRCQLGGRYAANGEPKKSLIQFEKAAKLDPSLIGATAGIAMAHEMLNRYDRARRVVDPFIKRGPAPPSIASVAMRVLMHEGEPDAAVEVGERSVGAATEPDMMLRAARFSLAKAYERAGRHADAIDEATRANATCALAYDPAAYHLPIDRIEAFFTPERLASLPRPGAPSDMPVFIVGFPRCGSTLTERIIAAHPEAHGAGEIDALFEVLTDLARAKQVRYPDCLNDLTSDELSGLEHEYVERLRSLAPRARRITNKHLGNARHVACMAVALPGAKIIHTRRDALDTCLSCFLEPLAPAQAPFCISQASLGEHYLHHERMMAHWHDVLDVDILEVDYEELTNDLEGQTRRILEFIDLPFDEACLRFHEKAVAGTFSYDQVRRPIYRSSVGRADRFGPSLDALRKALGQPPFAPSPNAMDHAP